MSNVKQILTSARALIEQGWAQSSYARRADELTVDVLNEHAVCFCMVGSVLRASNVSCAAYDRDEFPDVAEALNVIRLAINSFPIVQFNDSPNRVKEDVIAAFDRAIASVEG